MMRPDFSKGTFDKFLEEKALVTNFEGIINKF